MEKLKNYEKKQKYRENKELAMEEFQKKMKATEIEIIFCVYRTIFEFPTFVCSNNRMYVRTQKYVM